MLFFYLAAVNAKGSLLCIERSPIVIHTGLSSSNKMEAKAKITRKIIPVIPNDNQSMTIYLINVAIRSTYFIFCCRNRNWDSPDLIKFGFFLFCFVLCFVFICFNFFWIIQSQAASCKLPICSEIYNCAFKNRNKVSIEFTIIIIIIITIIYITIKQGTGVKTQLKSMRIICFDDLTLLYNMPCQIYETDYPDNNYMEKK